MSNTQYSTRSKPDEGKESGTESGTDNSSEQFVNTAKERWEQLRRDWVKPSPENIGQKKGEVRAKTIDIEDVIERIYSQSSNGTLREPVPLGQMIDLLIDFWEADGLYD